MRRILSIRGVIAAGALIVLLAAGVTYAATRMFDVAITGTVNLIVSGDAIEVRSGDTRIQSGFTLDFGTAEVDFFGRGPVPVRGPFQVKNVSNGPVHVVVTGGASSGILPLFGPTTGDLEPGPDNAFTLAASGDMKTGYLGLQFLSLNTGSRQTAIIFRATDSGGIPLRPGNILWDTSHRIYLGYSPAGRHSSLKTLLVGRGYTVDENSSGVLNRDLGNYQIVVISVGSAWDSEYSGDEVTVIQNYVNGGGGLLILGDNPNTPNANINPVAQAFGTTLGVGTTLSPSDLYVTTFTAHPIFTRVKKIYMRAAGEITGNSPSLIVASTSSGDAVVTVAEPGLGRVVAMGDTSTMENTYISSADNQSFSENVFDWLGSVTVASGSISMPRFDPGSGPVNGNGQNLIDDPTQVTTTAP